MAMPRTVCELVKDKLLSVQTGFVETFNWIANLCKEKVVTKIEAGDDTNIEVAEEKDETNGGVKLKINVYYK
jgi:hypothetical protein